MKQTYSGYLMGILKGATKDDLSWVRDSIYWTATGCEGLFKYEDQTYKITITPVNMEEE